MKKREPVSHIMTKNVHAVVYSDSLKDVSNIMKTEKIHHLPVLKGNEIVGIISSSDINKLSMGNLYENQDGMEEAVMDSLKLEQVMTHNPVIIDSNDSIKEVAEVFASANFHALPVTENNHIVGIVTTKDVLKYLLDQY